MTSLRLRRMRVNLALLAASCLVAVLGAEIAVRAFVRDADRTPARVLKGPRALLDCYASNPRGYFETDLRDAAQRHALRAFAEADLVRTAAATPWVVETRLNSDLFRDVEPGPKPPRVKRVVVIGDSFTAGQGVHEDDTYPRHLARLLDVAEPGAYQVRACAIRGFDFPAIEGLIEKALEYEADLVVYGMVLNDVEQSAHFAGEYPVVNDWILNHSRAAEGSAPLRLYGFVAGRIESYRLGRAATRWYQDMYQSPNRDGWQRTQERIRGMKNRIRARGGRFVLALWPLLVGLEGDYPFAEAHQTVAAFCASAGIPFLDLRTALAGRRSADLWVHETDHHPNEIAHALAAESLLPTTQRLAGRARGGGER